MDDRKKKSTTRDMELPPRKTEPERQYGGPESGLPPPFIVGQELAPYLIVGIDFGSTFCRVSTFSKGKAYAIKPHEFGAQVEDALQLGKAAPQLGHSAKEFLAGNRSVKHGDRTHSGTELATKLFRLLKGKVEASTERLLAKAVISVPACFTHRQRQSVISSAQDAEIAVLGLINEPIAAALDACYTNNLKNGRYLVLAGGAYTFEAAIVHVQNRLIETKALRGDLGLSGDALDTMLSESIQEEFAVKKKDVSTAQLEDAKKKLDLHGAAVLQVGGKKHSLTRSLVRDWLGDYIERITSLIDATLEAAQTQQSDVVGIILTGQATNLWVLLDILCQRLGSASIFSGNVSAGAAIQAALLVRQEKDWVVWDALADPVFVAQGEHVRQVIASNSPLPLSGHIALVPGEDGQTISTILQATSDPAGTLTQVASVKVVEELEGSESTATVDLAVTATADGTLSFAARHHKLDVNLTVEVLEPGNEPSEVIELAVLSLADSAEQGNFDTGVIVQQAEGHWLIQEVNEGSPAWNAGIQVYDELLAIDGKEARDLDTEVGARLTGGFGAVRRLTLNNGEMVHSVTVECTMPAERHDAEQLKLRIADATLAGNDRELALALLGFARHESNLESGEWEKPAALAVRKAKELPEPDDSLVVRALCAWCVLELQSIRHSPSRTLNFTAMNDVLDGILRICEGRGDLSSAAGAAIFELAGHLSSHKHQFPLLRKPKKLLEKVAVIMRARKVSPAAYRRVWQAYFNEESCKPRHLPAVVDSEEDIDEKQLHLQYAERLKWGLTDRMEVSEVADLFSEFSEHIKRGLLPSPEYVIVMPFEAAMFYKRQGDKWLEYEARNRTPDETELDRLRRSCASQRIVVCQSSKQAYEIARLIILNQVEKDDCGQDDEVHYQSLLAGVSAGQGEAEAVEGACMRARVLSAQIGNRAIKNTAIETACEVYFIARRHRAVEDLCIDQLRRLDLNVEGHLKQICTCYTFLARAYSIMGEYELAKDAYGRLVELPGVENARLWDYLNQFAEFLVRIEDSSATDVIARADELGRKLRFITEENASSWYTKLREARGKRDFG